jgi:ribosome modulation factor
MLEDSGPAVQPSGNRCGHVPEASCWLEPPESHKPRPGIRERREACLWVLGYLVHYLDLLTWRPVALRAFLYPPGGAPTMGDPPPGEVTVFGPLRAYYEYGQPAGLRHEPLDACRYRRPDRRNAWARGWPDGQDHRFRLGAFQQARLRLEQAESPHQGPVQTPRPR